MALSKTEITEKTCTKCGDVKGIDSFPWCTKSATGKRYRQGRCRDCARLDANARKRERYATDKAYRDLAKASSNDYFASMSGAQRERYRKNRKMKFYGLSESEYDELFHGDIRCAICNGADPIDADWHIDHCHETLKVRGLLCGLCNKGLGLFKDNMANLERAIAYLEVNGA